MSYRFPRKVLFVAPHADDIEMLCGSTCQAAVEAGFEVHECLSNSDEYGTENLAFKGRRMARIRRREMDHAAKCYGIRSNVKSKIILHWMPYIDGFVPFNRETVARYQQLFREIRPWASFGPDPFFTIDSHNDHLMTGRNYYFALKGLSAEERPRWMFFFQTYMPDFYIRYVTKPVVEAAIRSHGSQFSPQLIKIMIPFGNLQKHFPFLGGRKAEAFRRVTFDPIDHRLPEDRWCPWIRLKRGFWQYGFKFGQNDKKIYLKPGYMPILEDYRKNGWPGEIFGRPLL